MRVTLRPDSLSLATAGRTRGFTLIEVMIALSILSISLVALLGLNNRNIALAAYSRHLTEATLLARQQTTEMGLSGFLDIGERKGDFGDGSPEYHWTANIKETPFPMIRELAVAVHWKEGGLPEQVSLTTYLFRR